MNRCELMKPPNPPYPEPLLRSRKSLLRNPGAVFAGVEPDLVGRRPKFPRYGRLPRGLAVPGSAPKQLHDVAEGGAFIPLGRQNQIQNTTNFPPTRGIFRDIRLSGGAFCGPAERNGATPATARVSAALKVYI